MKYVVIQTGGKQYKASVGDILEIERLTTEAGQDFQFDKVLLYTADGVSQIGQPNLDDITVTATVLEQIRGEKLRIGKYKAKAKYRRITGHRQALSKVQIKSIAIKGAKEEKPAPVKEEKAKEVKTVKKEAKANQE